MTHRCGSASRTSYSRRGDGRLEDCAVNGLKRLLGRGIGDQTPIADDRESGTELSHVLDDVGREQDDPLFGQLREQAVESQPLLGIEAGGGLVHDDQPRVAGDGLGDAQPLAHAPRIGLHLAAGRE